MVASAFTNIAELEINEISNSVFFINLFVKKGISYRSLICAIKF